jgi:hypothetical protein
MKSIFNKVTFFISGAIFAGWYLDELYEVFRGLLRLGLLGCAVILMTALIVVLTRWSNRWLEW